MPQDCATTVNLGSGPEENFRCRHQFLPHFQGCRRESEENTILESA